MARSLLVAVLVVLLAGAAPAGAQTALYPLGDSITYGATLATVNTPGGYRAPLRDDLDAAGVTLRFVGSSTTNPPVTGVLDPSRWLHDGWPGARVDQIRDALTGPSPLNGGEWLTGTATRPPIVPDVVVVHLGTNDIGQAFDPGQAYPGGSYTPADPAERAVFAGHLAGRLDGLLDDLRARVPGVRLVVATIVPMADPTAATYNDLIRTQVIPRQRALGTPTALADVEAAITDPALQVSGDGVHPTPAGYDAMAAAIAPAVAELAR